MSDHKIISKLASQLICGSVTGVVNSFGGVAYMCSIDYGRSLKALRISWSLCSVFLCVPHALLCFSVFHYVLPFSVFVCVSHVVMCSTVFCYHVFCYLLYVNMCFVIVILCSTVLPVFYCYIKVSAVFPVFYIIPPCATVMFTSHHDGCTLSKKAVHREIYIAIY